MSASSATVAVTSVTEELRPPAAEGVRGGAAVAETDGQKVEWQADVPLFIYKRPLQRFRSAPSTLAAVHEDCWSVWLCSRRADIPNDAEPLNAVLVGRSASGQKFRTLMASLMPQYVAAVHLTASTHIATASDSIAGDMSQIGRSELHQVILCNPPVDDLSKVLADDSAARVALLGVLDSLRRLPTGRELHEYLRLRQQDVSLKLATTWAGEFRSRVLDAAVDTEVVLMEACGRKTTGSLKSWVATGMMWIAVANRSYAFHWNSEPRICISMSWLNAFREIVAVTTPDTRSHLCKKADWESQSAAGSTVASSRPTSACSRPGANSRPSSACWTSRPASSYGRPSSAGSVNPGTQMPGSSRPASARVRPQHALPMTLPSARPRSAGGVLPPAPSLVARPRPAGWAKPPSPPRPSSAAVRRTGAAGPDPQSGPAALTQDAHEAPSETPQECPEATHTVNAHNNATICLSKLLQIELAGQDASAWRLVEALPCSMRVRDGQHCCGFMEALTRPVEIGMLTPLVT
eukprot:TRINITY_DN16830_c0_g2_i1.p1 TRINITY_DN16830_c0_g2~~TRINITY_DN16830_c0_g2_i1.p1  ORF type:complete len:521 (-),score=55.38 TRINITY_DN16830_c0_g2_i1:89-1651(-)